MVTFVECKLEDNIKVVVNMDLVTHMVRTDNTTSVYFSSGDESKIIVKETTEKILQKSYR